MQAGPYLSLATLSEYRPSEERERGRDERRGHPIQWPGSIFPSLSLSLFLLISVPWAKMRHGNERGRGEESEGLNNEHFGPEEGRKERKKPNSAWLAPPAQKIAAASAATNKPLEGERSEKEGVDPAAQVTKYPHKQGRDE